MQDHPQWSAFDTGLIPSVSRGVQICMTLTQTSLRKVASSFSNFVCFDFVRIRTTYSLGTQSAYETLAWFVWYEGQGMVKNIIVIK